MASRLYCKNLYIVAAVYYHPFKEQDIHYTERVLCVAIRDYVALVTRLVFDKTFEARQIQTYETPFLDFFFGSW